MEQESVLGGLINQYVIGLGALLIIELVLFIQNIELLFLATIMTFVLYSFFVFMYVFGVFGVIESSIRIRILEIIQSFQKQGLSYRQLLTYYNANIILKKRLTRLVSSGDLVLKDGKYQIGKRISFLYFPAYLTRFLLKLYGN